jgi:hypothetical protein
MTTKEPGSRSENLTAPKTWGLRCILYADKFADVLVAILCGTGAMILSLDREWLGASVCVAAGGVSAVVGWQRLHGKLMQRGKAQRVGSAVVVGLLWVLASHLLLKNGWGLALVEGLLYGLGQFSVMSYMHSGEDDRSDK